MTCIVRSGRKVYPFEDIKVSVWRREGRRDRKEFLKWKEVVTKRRASLQGQHT